MAIKFDQGSRKDTCREQSVRSPHSERWTTDGENTCCYVVARKRRFHVQRQPSGETFRLLNGISSRRSPSYLIRVAFLAPFIIRAKIFLQEMWAAGMDWDDLFLGDLASKARKWFKELEDLPTIKVPRCIRLGQDKKMLSQTLHTFVDASQDAYGGAVVYSRASIQQQYP